MKIFALEDDPDRIKWLDRFLFQQRGIEWQCVHTGLRADEFVGPYDVVLLDHDLGGRELTAHEDDGLAFLRAIRDRLGNALVIVHSWNSVGAQNMKAEWPSVVVAQFGSDRFKTLLAAAIR